MGYPVRPRNFAARTKSKPLRFGKACFSVIIPIKRLYLYSIRNLSMHDAAASVPCTADKRLNRDYQFFSIQNGACFCAYEIVFFSEHPFEYPSFPYSNSLNFSRRGSIVSTLQLQLPWLRFCPQTGHRPEQSSRHNGTMGIFSTSVSSIA